MLQVSSFVFSMFINPLLCCAPHPFKEGTSHLTSLLFPRQTVGKPIKTLRTVRVGSQTFRSRREILQQTKESSAEPAQKKGSLDFDSFSRSLLSFHLIWNFIRVSSWSPETMMYSAFNTDCDSSSRCSTASPSCDKLVYFNSPEGSYSSMGSPQSQVYWSINVAYCLYNFI